MNCNVNSPFAEFGDIEVVPVQKIQRIVAKHLAENWARIPHVFHQDEADVRELEAAREALNIRTSKRITSLALYVKVLQVALRQFPRFNSSLDASGETLTLKNYFNVGIAVDTPRGLVVPVIRNVDQKSVVEIAEEIEVMSGKARQSGLSMKEMAGGCMSISSLGRLGGTGFTPIINAPEVAILGLSRLLEKPVKVSGGGIEWRQFIPLSLSYDHRVINGADAAQFMRFVVEIIESPVALANIVGT